jgi:hypothetical protein
VGDTSSVVSSIRNKGISYEEVMSEINKIYEELLKVRPSVSKCSKYNNISYNYRNKLIKIFKELLCKTKNKERSKKLISEFDQANRVPSIEGIKGLLSIQELREYVKTNYIDTKQLIIEFLEEGGLSCHNKKLMMETYPKFVAAV